MILVHYRYAIVRDMTAAGLGLNKFCYAGLIAAFQNRTPISEETTSKVYVNSFLVLLFMCLLLLANFLVIFLWIDH